METHKTFDVRWDGTTTAAPETVWEAVTKHTAAWLWEVDYEPRVGGAERGLTAAGGTVTVWDPPRRFQTRLDEPGGHFNQVTYDLEPRADGGTRISFHHTTNVPVDEHALQLDACETHTDLYRHTMLEYVTSFAGAEPAYVNVAASGTRDEVLAALGLPAAPQVGDEALGGVVDYATGPFVGVRTPGGLLRVYDRTRWGWGIDVTYHGFTGADDAHAMIDHVPTTTKVA